GIGSVASGASSVAIGSNASAPAANSVALGSGSVATQANTVSVGAPGAERRITNVAAGIAPTDGGNVSQLTRVASGFQQQINVFQQQINNLAGTVGNIDNRLRDGVALAMAAGGVPAVPNGRRFGMFGNVAAYDGHGAAGVGLVGVLYENQAFQL